MERQFKIEGNVEIDLESETLESFKEELRSKGLTQIDAILDDWCVYYTCKGNFEQCKALLHLMYCGSDDIAEMFEEDYEEPKSIKEMLETYSKSCEKYNMLYIEEI